MLATEGGIEGLEGNESRCPWRAKIDANSADSAAYMDYLAAKQNQAITAVESVLARPIEVEYRYKATLNGFAAEFSPEEAAKVAQLPGVVRVVARADVSNCTPTLVQAGLALPVSGMAA